MQLQLDFQVVMTLCGAKYWHINIDSQSYEWISLSYEKSRKSIQSVRVPPITIAMGLQKTGQSPSNRKERRGDATAVGSMQSWLNRIDPRAIQRKRGGPGAIRNQT